VLRVVAATVGDCVSALAQQYSSATPASPLLHFLKQKYDAVQKVITSTSFIIFFFFFELRKCEIEKISVACVCVVASLSWRMLFNVTEKLNANL
jgi:hypothetical protein